MVARRTTHVELDEAADDGSAVRILARFGEEARPHLSAVTSMFDYLCNENAVEHNPVAGVKRLGEGANEGQTPALVAILPSTEC